MSAKTLVVLDDSELKDGQMKEVDFDSGKVLLSRLGDKIHATSAFCTHYGAPLAKGVLTADGRVVCPWHGACFSVVNGDIEDAPAPSAIHSFQARVADGKIHVTADPSKVTKDNMSRAPRLLATGVEIGGPGVVIVGGGSAAFHTIESLREHGYKGQVTVLTRETYAPIDRTKLSKALITDPSKLELRSAADLKIKYGTTLRTGITVTSIDTKSRNVILDSGKDAVSYDKLVLASGGLPRKLPIEGSDLENVYVLRDVQHAQAIDAACQEGKDLVVIGSSFISMELVVAVSKRKLKSIHVIGMEEYPFEAVLGKEIGAGLKKFHESQGVIFHPKAFVKAIHKSSSDPKKAASVELASGENLTADVVIMGVGVRPSTDYLKESGFSLEKDGSIKVDKYLKVLGHDDIYAVGDIATYPEFGEYRRIEHWNVAGNHGRAVGKTISGDPQPFVKVPVFWSAQGQQLRYCGTGAGHDDVIIKGDPGALKFVAYYAKQGKIVAVASMQNDPVVSQCSELIRLGLMPTAEEIRAGKDPLSVDTSTTSALPALKA